MRNNIIQIALARSHSLTLVLLVGIAFASPLLIKQQLIAGTITNAVLILGAFHLGIRSGIIIGILPSSVALATGLLPPLMAPMIPFIIMANIILVTVVCIVKNSNYWLAALSAGTLKFIFLFLSSVLISCVIFQHGIPSDLSMMAWPQLVTALGGGAAAYGIMKALAWI